MRTITRVAMMAVLALALAACGGGSDDDAADDTTTTAADGGATDDGGDDSGDEGADDGATDGSAVGGLLDEDCRFLLAGAYLNPLASAVPGVEVDFGDSAKQLQEIAEAAPEEIREAMTTVALGFAEMAEVLQDVDLNDPQAFADPAVQEAFAGLEDVFNDEYEAASEVVSDFITENCDGS